MRINPKKLSLEEFKELDEKSIARLIAVLNEFFNDVGYATANNISVKDNLFQEIKELDINYSASALPLSFRGKWNSKPIGIQVINAYEVGGTGITYPNLAWDFNGSITIKSMTGLTLGKRYKITLNIIYG